MSELSASPSCPRARRSRPSTSEALNAVMAETSAEQRHWLVGLSRRLPRGDRAGPRPLPAAAPRRRAPRSRSPILYGTDSGNAEGVAADAKKAAAQAGLRRAGCSTWPTPRRPRSPRPSHLLVIASTWGEGDPPERAAAFYQALMAEDAPRFEGVRFAVLALGDSSYVNFCEIGRRIDARLEALGGERIAARVDCDLDYEAPAADWTEGALEELADLAEPEPAGQRPRCARGEIIHVDFASAPAEPVWPRPTRSPAEITELVNLNSSALGQGDDPSRAVARGLGPDLRARRFARHRARERPRDGRGACCAAVGPRRRRGARGAAARRARHHHALAPGDRGLCQGSTRRRRCAELLAGDGWRGFARGPADGRSARGVPAARSTPEQLTGLLRKLPPRLYSVASSLAATPDEAHLLLGVVRYESHGRERQGVASAFVAQRLRAGDSSRSTSGRTGTSACPRIPTRRSS